MVISEIHTQFYSDEFAYLLKKFYTCMGYGKCGRSNIKNADSVSIDQDPNGEIVIRVIGDTWRTIYERKHSAAEILDWLGWMLKCQTHEMLERNGLDKRAQWNRGNFRVIVDFLSDENHKIYVSDVYYIYDALKCRKNIEKYYDYEIIEKWRGKQRDPVTTEAERTRREEITKVEEEYDAKIKNCNYEDYRYTWGKMTEARNELYIKYKEFEAEFVNNVKKMEAELGGKWKKEAERLKAEKAEKINEINNAMCMAKMLGL